MKDFFYQKIRLKNQDQPYLEFGQNNKTPLLCIHGYADSAEIFIQLGELLKNDFRIIVPNLPIANQSGQIQSLDSLEKFVDEFVKTLNLKDYFLLGFSIGGLIAISHSCKDNQVRKLILNNCPAKYFVSKKEEFIYRLLKPFLLTKFFCRIFSFIKTNRYLRNRLGSSKGPKTIGLMKNHYYEIFGTEFNLLDLDLSQKLNKLTIPKIVFIFKDDEVVKFNRYEDSFNHLNCRLYYVEEGGHNAKSCYWQNVAKVLSALK